MSRFKDEEYITAAKKEKILDLWIRFLKNGFKRNDFTKELYKYLTLYCDFIAHFNEHGFYAEYFTTGDGKQRFLEQFDRRQIRSNNWIGFKLTGSCADLNNALFDEAEKYLSVLYAGAKAEQKDLDLRIVEKLLERHGMTLSAAVKPNAGEIKTIAGTQADLFS